MSTLKLRVEGNGEPVSLDSFLDTLNNARYALYDVDHRVTERKTAAFEWTIADLKMSSPNPVAVLESRPVSRRVDPRWAELVTGGFVSALATAEQGDALPPRLSIAGLEHLRRLGAKLGKNGAVRFEAFYVEKEIGAAVTPIAAENIKRLTVADSSAIGSVVGTLEMVSTHRRYRYSVYDGLTGREVKCEFPAGDLESVKAALTCRVMVSGVVHRNARGEPLRISQPRLTVLPSGDELPRTDQLIGVDPEFTGDLTTDEYLRQAWDA